MNNLETKIKENQNMTGTFFDYSCQLFYRFLDFKDRYLAERKYGREFDCLNNLGKIGLTSKAQRAYMRENYCNYRRDGFTIEGALKTIK